MCRATSMQPALSWWCVWGIYVNGTEGVMARAWLALEPQCWWAHTRRTAMRWRAMPTMVWRARPPQDNRECWWYTGEESFELLKLMFAYINADKAFDTITEYRKERANNSAKDKQKGGRKSALTPFEQFVFWRVVFKRFRGRGQLHHGGNLFGLPARSADRLYITWTQAMGRFFDGKGLASLCTRACVCAS